jgi:hypothetical protein
MGAQRVDGNRLAGEVLDRFDRAAIQRIEDAFGLLVDAVGRIGGDEIVAAGNRVENCGGRGTAEFDIAGGQREEGRRATLGITNILDLDARAVEIAERVGKFMAGQAA